MTELELRTMVYQAARAAVADEGVFTPDQSKAIADAAVAIIDTLLDAGAIEAPRVTRRQEAELRRIDAQRSGPTVAVFDPE